MAVEFAYKEVFDWGRLAQRTTENEHAGSLESKRFPGEGLKWHNQSEK